jgi:hypothetical protein
VINGVRGRSMRSTRISGKVFATNEALGDLRGRRGSWNVRGKIERKKNR